MFADRDDEYEYAPVPRAAERAAIRDIRAAAARDGDRSTLRLLNLFWSGLVRRTYRAPRCTSLPPSNQLSPVPPTPLRPSNLTARDALRIYNAMSFALWRYGLEGIMTSHIIVLWETLGVTDHEQAAYLLGSFLNHPKKKFERVRLIELQPGIRNWQTPTGFALNYCYIWENSPRRGLHTHILATIPSQFKTAFKKWTQETLAHMTDRPCLPKTVEVVAPSARVNSVAVTSWY